MTTTILQDRRLALRLAERPEFLLRLDEFVQHHGIGESPALIVQARPAPSSAPQSVDVDDHALQQRFGAGTVATNPWWQGFRTTYRAAPTFHGVVSRGETWANEVHRDGHFIAGVWKFPELSTQVSTSVAAVFDFYAGMFDDFLGIVAATLQPEPQAPIYEATATLVNAPMLHFARQADFGSHTLAKPLSVQHLQWTIQTAALGSPEWGAVARVMGAALAGAYGATLPARK